MAIKYLIANRKARFLLSTCDQALKVTCAPFIKKGKEIAPPSKILLSNIAHLGDIVLTTALLAPLKASFPHVEIGLLASTFTAPLIEHHPLLSFIHTVDHWKLNRTPLSPLQKLSQYWKTRRQALQEVKRIGYDIAVDCTFHFPGMAPFFFEASIPTRIGYTSSGLSPLLTHAHTLSTAPYNVAEHYLRLLTPLGPFNPTLLKPSLPPLTVPPPLPSKQYIVVHMGSGNPLKEWPPDHWKALLSPLTLPILFTGQGHREHATIEYVRSHLPRSHNLCNTLSLPALISTLHHARLLIGVDSAAGHIAAATHTPSLLLYTSLHPPTLWRPFSPLATLLTSPTPLLSSLPVHIVRQTLFALLLKST